MAIVLVYANSLSAPFIYDDEYSVVSNPAIRTLGGAWHQPANTPLAGRPVTGFTFALNFAASGLDAAVYRATNIAIHAGCALLLFGLIRRTLISPRLRSRFGLRASTVALAVTGLWAVHPLTTDAVTFITQRTESLMAFFYLLTLYASVRAHVETSGMPASASGHLAWQAVAIAACALGMGSKESMVTAPLMVVLYDRIFLFDSWKDALNSRRRLYLGLALTWWMLAFQVVTTPRSGSAGFSSGVSVWTYLLNQTVMIVRYLKLAVWPSDLVITYGKPVGYALRDVFPQAIVVLAAFVATIAAFRFSPTAGFLGAWFFVTLAPSSSFIPVATEVGAERRMYLPLMAIITAVVGTLWIVAHARRRPPDRIFWLSVVAVGIGLGAATIGRNREHQSWLELSQRTLERWPTDVAYAAVGGELARLKRDEEALPLLQVGARSDVRARYNLGVALYNLGRYQDAIRELEPVVGGDPMREEVPWARRLMGHAYSRLSRFPDAIAQLRMAIAMTPHDADARQLLVDAYNSHGVNLAESGRFDDAIDNFRRGLELDERNPSLRYNLATALFDSGRLAEAQSEARRALAESPKNADAHHLLGKLLALQGNLKEGLVSLETAAKLKPEDQVIRGDLEKLRAAAR
jgi:Flp pilus assembly protein TadD